MENEMVFAVPGEGNIIDIVLPDGLSCYARETLEQVRVRYPGAVLMSMEKWLDAKAERQNRPVIWAEVSEDDFFRMFEVLYPAAMGHSDDNGKALAFLVGEASDHCARTGRPRFQAYKSEGGKRWAASRPMTTVEFSETVLAVRP